MKDTDFGDRAYRYKAHFRKKIIFIPFLVAAGLALISYIVMLLWNGLLPEILHTGTITFWQAMGLFILAKILFGFGKGGGRGGAPWMRHKMEKWRDMSPEERDRLREQMRSRCNKWGRHRGGFDWDQPAENATHAAEEPVKPTE